MLEGDLIARILKVSAGVAGLVTLLLFCGGRSAWAWGFLIGAALSLFSMFSLAVLVPQQFRPGATRRARRWLLLTLILKLPLYAAGLYLVTRVQGISPVAAMFGIALAPIVITLKAIGSALTPLETERVISSHP